MNIGASALISVVRPFTRNTTKSTLAGILGAFVLAFSAVDAAADTRIIFGAYSSDKPSAMVAQLHPTLDAVSKKMAEMYGERVTFRTQIVRGYKRGVDLLVAQKVDVMRLGPASYVIAKKQAPRISILAMENLMGHNVFNGVIAVHRDSPLSDLSQLRDRTFAFGAKWSTLGRFFAQITLTQAGVLAKDLRSFKYLGRHDKVGRAVGAEQFEAGALEETIFERLVTEGIPIRALATYSNATRPWIARAGLAPEVAGKIRNAMLAVGDMAAIKSLRFYGFLPGDDEAFELTRQVIEGNHKFFAGYVGKNP